MSARAKKAPPREPTLEERRQPGLSETLPHPRRPWLCQACGGRHEETNPLSRWLEHDEWDKVPRDPRVVVLCRRCSTQLIEAHPRLYRALTNGEPFPGAMSVCVRCPLRRALTCTSPAAERAGGSGLRYEFSQPPMYAHLNMGRGGASGWQWFFPGRVLDCSGRPFISPELTRAPDATEGQGSLGV